MNETNHKRIIYGLKINADFETLNEASKFTDSIKAADDYFYYHFYYDFNINGNTIQLIRVDEKEKDAFVKSMKKCGDKYDSETNKYYSDLSQKGRLVSSPNREWSTKLDKKEFFSTFINNRNKSEHFSFKDLKTGGNNSFLDVGNQSDNVAFLHAMAAVDEDAETAMTVFKTHLKKCFTEYLFILDPQKAQFVLGIALHGIMDSFTPSHMEFQNYAKQDWGLHAQGDVVPFTRDRVEFDPGQAVKEEWYVQIFFDLKKDYNSDNHINDKEFEMFKIFTVIGALENDEEIKKINKGEYSLSESTSNYVANPATFETVETLGVEPRSKHKLNDVLKTKNYSDNAYVFSNAAMDVCEKVYIFLSKTKSEIKNYSDYKKKKNDAYDNPESNICTTDTVIDAAIKIWEDKYNSKELQEIRTNLFEQIREIRGFSDNDKKNNKNPFAE